MSNKAFPAGPTTSCTLTLIPMARQSSGTGAFSASTPVTLPSMAIVFPNGRTDATTLASIRQACLQHLLNIDALTAWWSPRSGTVESNLRTALDACAAPIAYSQNPSWVLMFDGQFGSVLAA